MLRVDKEKTVSELKEKLVKSKSLFLTDFTGLKVSEMSQLRRSFRENKAEFRVAKNSLFRLAAKQAGVDEILSYLDGPTGIIFGYDNPTILAKLLHDSIKKIEKPKIKMFLVEGKLYPGQEIKKLALIPPREVLLAQIIGNINSPIANLIGILDGIIREFVVTVDGIARAKAK
jgi:large subunit ribosomal protein L10